MTENSERYRAWMMGDSFGELGKDMKLLGHVST